MRILIAEDDLTSRTVLTTVLRKCGHEVQATCDGTEAWQALQQPNPPPLAILDWMMPGVDGVELCRRARTSQGDRPLYLVLLTTRSSKESIAEGLRAGADDYVTKPFNPVELSARVEVGCRMIAVQERLAQKIRELQEALAHIKTLRGIIPICAGCKQIRDDQGYWRQVEAYITAHSEAQFSHALCPDCARKYFPEVAGPEGPV